MIIHYAVKENIYCRYYLQAFSTEEILKRHVKICYKINSKQRVILSKKAKHLNSKIMKEN